MVPDWLQWTVVVLSFIAFWLAIMTLPTAAQMWWGRPSLSIKYERSRFDPGVGLSCYIENVHVKSKILLMLGVVRETAYAVKVGAIIRESGSGKAVSRIIPNINVEGAPPSSRANLHPGVPAFATLVFQGQDAVAVVVPPRDDGAETALSPGEYDCEVTVTCGAKYSKVQTTFVVENNANNTLRIT